MGVLQLLLIEEHFLICYNSENRIEKEKHQ